jgi:hypothetical protein
MCCLYLLHGAEPARLHEHFQFSSFLPLNEYSPANNITKHATQTSRTLHEVLGTALANPQTLIITIVKT